MGRVLCRVVGPLVHVGAGGDLTFERLVGVTMIGAGGYSAGLIYHMLGIKLPISVLTIQAMVTQPLKPLRSLLALML